MKVLHVKVELTDNIEKFIGKIERSAEAFRVRHPRHLFLHQIHSPNTVWVTKPAKG
jgi:copper oxidase (laccase) domain-containing protein